MEPALEFPLLGIGELDCSLDLELPHDLSEIAELFEIGFPFRRGAARARRVVYLVHVLNGRPKDAFPTPSCSSQELQRLHINWCQ